MRGKCKAAGGKIKEDVDMAGEKKELKEGAAYKCGGKAKGKKHGGKIKGKAPHHRADKFARGGAAKKVISAAGMSASSPLSGAGKTKEPSKPEVDKEDD